MFKYLSSIRTSRKLLALGTIVIILLSLAAGVVLLRQTSSEVAAESILKISYCGVDPEELCVLSFGRDLEDNMVINLFVPDRNFPYFYLKIKRTVVESIYECEKDKEVPTSVYCTGESIGLQEKMEINLISKEDDHLMAVGKLALLAVLLSPVGGGVQVQETPSALADGSNFSVTVEPFPTIPFPTKVIPTVTPTSNSYP